MATLRLLPNTMTRSRHMTAPCSGRVSHFQQKTTRGSMRTSAVLKRRFFRFDGCYTGSFVHASWLTGLGGVLPEDSGDCCASCANVELLEYVFDVLSHGVR